jgi:hypothetical protein
MLKNYINKERIMKKIAVITAAVSLTAFGQVAMAFGLPEIPGVSSVAATKDVNAGQLVKQLNDSLFNLTTAQQNIFEAFGLKQDAEQAASNAKVFQTGNSTDAAVIEKTGTADAKILELIDKKEKLSEEGKKKLVQALPYYGKGLVSSAGLGAQLAQAATTISANPMSVASGPFKATDLITVFTSSPDLLTKIVSTGHKFITYSSDNGIDTSEVESSLKDIK